jgi:hypothetical protein
MVENPSPGTPSSDGEKTASRPRAPQSLSFSGMLGDFRLLFILFIALRVMLLIVYEPLLIQNIERGISVGGDFQAFFHDASLSTRIGLPMRDWWTEYPPLWSYFSILVYQLQGANPSYSGFAGILALCFLAADAGNLILIRKIATHLYRPDTGMILAWIYTVLAVPMVLIFWTFEPMVAFTLLLGLWWMVQERYARSSVAISIGALIKFTPALVLGGLWRMRRPRLALWYTIVLLGIFVLVYTPFLLQNSAMTLPSLTAQFNKASYETVWALIDGNYRTGNFGPLADRVDPAKANVVVSNPPVIPPFVRLGVAAGVGSLVFIRTRRFDDKGLVAFVGITVLIFFLQAQGWSPQWLLQIIPFVLLCFPTRRGVLIVLVLSLVSLAEYPFLFNRTGDTDGVISGALVTPFVILVLVRTTVLVGLCVALYKILRQVRGTSSLV